MSNEQRKSCNSLLLGVLGTAVVILGMGFYTLLTFFVDEQIAWIIAVIVGASVILGVAAFIGPKIKRSDSIKASMPTTKESKEESKEITSGQSEALSRVCSSNCVNGLNGFNLSSIAVATEDLRLSL